MSPLAWAIVVTLLTVASASTICPDSPRQDNSFMKENALMYKISFGIYVAATIVLAAFLVCLCCVIRQRRPKKFHCQSVNEVSASEEEDSQDLDSISELPEERYGLGSCCGDGGPNTDSNYFLQIMVLILLCLASRVVFLAVIFV